MPVYYYRIGYRKGRRQPCVAVSFNLEVPTPFPALTAVDDFLRNILAMKTIVGRSDDADATDDALSFYLQLASRILHLECELRQAAGIPVLEPGEALLVEPVSKGSKQFRVRALVPRLDYFPEGGELTALRGATEIIFRLLRQPIADAEIPAFLDEIDRKYLAPLKIRPAGHKPADVAMMMGVLNTGIPFRHLGGGTFQIGWGSRLNLLERTFFRADSLIGAQQSQNKLVAARLMRQAGLPVPEHRLVNGEQEALAAAKELGWPVVVKPADRDRGEGITVDVRTPESLKAALAHAGKYSRQILVERTLPGICHRLLIGNGRLIFASKRVPPYLVADGEKTVDQLFDEDAALERRKPSWLRGIVPPKDDLAKECVALSGFSFDSVPPKGSKLFIRKTESTEWGGITEDVTAQVHPANVEIAVRAAELFGLTAAGVDLMTPDVTQPWYENGAAINEVNFSPYMAARNANGQKLLKTFLTDLLGGDGRIPLELFVGGQAAWEVACERQRVIVARGLRCFVTAANRTQSEAGEMLPMPAQHLFDRCTALLLNRRVDALLVVVQNADLLESGLPFDRFDALHWVPDPAGVGAVLGEAALGALQNLLEAHLQAPAAPAGDALSVA